MSDITGPPLPKPVDPAHRATGKTSNVSKDPQKQETQARNEKGDTSTRNENAENARGREPAVSISASAAHLHIGEELKENVTKIDNEGRPIIVTETATFALRPDAGLRPGDDVRLEIVAAGKTLSAELLEKNGRRIDPPVKLSLVVIAIHQKPENVTGTSDKVSAQPKLPTNSYAPTRSVAGASDLKSDQTENLANILASRSTSSEPAQANQNPSPPTYRPVQGSEISSKPIIEQTSNPDLVSGRSSSSDLATLIAAQQSQVRVGAQNARATHAPDRGVPLAPNQGHFIPQSNLTELQGGTTFPDTRTAGLGPKTAVFTMDGRPKTIQLMDPSISRVPPHEVATVDLVRPLPPNEAKSLPIPVGSLPDNKSALAVIETSKGKFVMQLETAKNLTGEMVRIGEVSVQQASTPPREVMQYQAKLAPASAGPKQSAVLVLSANDGAENSGNARIRAVHTLRAFLSAQGPQTDLRIETTRGELFVTLPNTVRPASGDTVEIITKTPSLMNVSAPQAGESTTNTLATSTAIASLGTHSWPALSEALTTLQTSDPAAANSLASKGANGGGNLTNSLMFLLSAAGRGDPGAWLGKDVEQALAQQNKGLLETLKADLGKLLATSSADAPGEWRSLILPLDTRQADMPLIALLLGHPPRPEEDGARSSGKDIGGEDDQTGQRFVLEVQFTVLGPIQLDGVIKDTQFDLALRSAQSLPPELCKDARLLFHQALEANGYSGQLKIEEQVPFPIQVEDILSQNLAAVPS